MYRDLNDYEILYMVCDERDNNFNILMKKYRPLIYKVSKDYLYTFKKFGYEIDDLMQIGYITLYKSSSLYDTYNDTMFYTYFKRAFYNSIISIMRFNITSKKEVLNNAISYDLKIPNTDISYIELFEDKKVFCDYSKELIIFKNSMPSIFSWIFELFYNGYTKEEISILLDEKLEKIREIIGKIKTHALTYKPLFFQ